MTAYAWQQCVSRVRTVWGRNTKWDRAERLWRNDRRIRNSTKDAVMSAIGSFELEGTEWAPSVPQVLTRAAGGGGYRHPSGPVDPEGCPHRLWGAVGSTRVCASCLKEVETDE